MRSLLLAAALLLPSINPTKDSPMAAIQSPAQKSEMTDANGSFDVKLVPTGHAPDPAIQSLSIDKTFHGALEATSKGEMLASGGPTTGNGGYVAIEQVTGTLNGKSGTFALMHYGTMIKGDVPQLTVMVVPGSGAGDLSGLYGTMTIAIAADGKHTYTLRYAFSTK